MFKKHALSMAEGSASFVLAALGGSTYRPEYGLPSLRRSGFAQAGRLLRPRWTAFLTILLAVLMPFLIS